MKLFLNEDCMDVMKRYPDNYFDLAIVDPPYFSGPEKRKFYGRKVSPIGVSRLYGETSEWQIPNRDYFDELFRVSKNQIIWGVNYFNYSFGSGRIVWDKVNGHSSFSDCEIAYCSLHDSTRLFRYMWNGMMQGKSISEGHIQQGNKALNEARIHPTQKPVNLYIWLLHTYENLYKSVSLPDWKESDEVILVSLANKEQIESDERYRLTENCRFFGDRICIFCEQVKKNNYILKNLEWLFCGYFSAT